MKLLKFIGMLLIAMIMCVNFIACGDDENSEKLDLSLLEGTWYVTHGVSEVKTATNGGKNRCYNTLIFS